MIINEINSKSIIVKSNLPDADYVVNPYTGCPHGCIYCYAKFMKRFTNHPEDWGQFVDVKINSADLINVNSKKYFNKSIFVSSVTDSYMSIDKKYLLTRKILEKLSSLCANISIQTKSDLVLRDIDIISKMKNTEVGFTVTTLDDNLRKQIEPFASPVNNRLNALKELNKNNIKNYIFIGPIFPYLTDWKAIIMETKSYVDRYMFENLNVRGTVWYSIKRWLTDCYPDLLTKYEEIYFAKNDFWEKMRIDIIEFCKNNKIDNKIYFYHKNKSKS